MRHTAIAVAVIVSVSWAAAGAPTTAPVGEGPAARAVEDLERIAAIDNAACRAFAAGMAEVFSKRGVALPASLRGLGERPAAAGELRGKELERFRSAVSDFVSACGYMGGGSPEEERAVHPLRVELLSKVARQCPCPGGRLFAAQFLWEWVFPDGEGRRPPEAMVGAKLAADAADAALTFALTRAAEGDRWPRTLLAIQAVKAAQALATLRAIADGSASQESLAKSVEDLEAKLKSFEKEGNPAEFTRVLARMKAMVGKLREQPGLVVESLNIQLQAVRLVQSFFAAVNREDKAGAAKLMTERAAKKLAGVKSLREAFGGSPQAVEVRLDGLAPVGELGGRLNVQVGLTVRDAKGVVRKRQVGLPLAKSKDGLRIDAE